MYLKTSEGDAVGHVDLVSRTVVATVAGYESELQMCLARWVPTVEPAIVSPAAVETEVVEEPVEAEVEAPSDPEVAPPTAPGSEARDLSTNVAGAAVWAKREEVNAQAPVRNMIARVLGVKTEERACGE